MLDAKKYKNATVLPTIKLDGHNFLGGVYSDGQCVKEAHHYTQAPYIDPMEFIDKTVIFGGMLFNHYGHFLLESLSRLWYIRNYPHVDICWTYAWPYNYGTVKWQHQIFDLVGLENKHIYVTKPTKFSELIVPYPGIIHQKNFFSKEQAAAFVNHWPASPA